MGNPNEEIIWEGDPRFDPTVNPAPADPDPLLDEVEPAPVVELTGLALVEFEHGFTFGGGPAPSGVTVAVVQCVNPTCKHRNQMVEVHDGHPTPVFCGGCSTVLHCAHEFEDRVRHEGTIGAAVEVRESVCRHCGTVDHEDRKPIVIRVEDLPVAALTALLAGGN